MSARAALAAQIRAGAMPDAKKAPKRRGSPEAEIQRAIVAGLRWALPRDSIVHHSPHEQRGSGEAERRRQAIAQGMGVHPGFADLIVLATGRVVFLEVKTATGRQSAAQRRFQQLTEAQGHGYAVVHSLDEAFDVLAALGVVLRRVSVRGGR